MARRLGKQEEETIRTKARLDYWMALATGNYDRQNELRKQYTFLGGTDQIRYDFREIETQPTPLPQISRLSELSDDEMKRLLELEKRAAIDELCERYRDYGLVTLVNTKTNARRP